MKSAEVHATQKDLGLEGFLLRGKSGEMRQNCFSSEGSIKCVVVASFIRPGDLLGLPSSFFHAVLVVVVV